MKKTLCLILAALMYLSLGVLLTACDEHEHVYKTEWTYNETHHWHACEGENCLEAAEMAAHTWDEGTITSDASADADGTKTFTCTVCKATKGESIAFTGVSEDAWQEAIAEQKFTNVTIHYSFDNKAENMIQNHVVKITESDLSREMTMKINGVEHPAPSEYFTGEDADQQRTMFLDIFRNLLAERENFVYDKDLSCYIAPEEVTTTVSLGQEGTYGVEVMTNGKVIFSADGRLESFTCTLKESIYVNNALDHEVTGDMVWTFSDYGTTVVTPPAQ